MILGIMMGIVLIVLTYFMGKIMGNIWWGLLICEPKVRKYLKKKYPNHKIDFLGFDLWERHCLCELKGKSHLYGDVGINKNKSFYDRMEKIE